MATAERTTTSAPERRWTADERRAAIVEAAIAEFADGGLDGASTEAIARRAGISHAYLFRLFGTKRDLFAAAVERSNARVLEAFADALRRRRPDEPVQAALGGAYRRLIRDRKVLMFQLLAYAVAPGDERIRAVVHDGYRRVYRWVQREAGLSADHARLFMAQGLLLAVSEATGLPELHDRGGWLPRVTQAAMKGGL